MKEITENLHINFENNKEYEFQIPNKQIAAIIMGSSGVGKTCLFNHLCKKSQQTGISNKRITEQTVSAQCMHNPGNLFKIYDTPGLEKKNEDKCLILRRTLKYIPFNLVIVVVKLQTRFEDSTITEMKRYSKLFIKKENEDKKIVFIVSSSDILNQWQEKDQIIKDFMECVKQNQIQQPVILLSNKNFDFQEVATILYELGVQRQKKLIQYDEGYLCRTMQLTNFQQSQKMKQRLDKYQNTENEQFLKIINEKSWLQKQQIIQQKQNKSWKWSWKLSWNIYDMFFRKNNQKEKTGNRQRDNKEQNNEKSDEQYDNYDWKEQPSPQNQITKNNHEQKEQQAKQQINSEVKSTITDETTNINQIQSHNQSNYDDNQQKDYCRDYIICI